MSLKASKQRCAKTLLKNITVNMKEGSSREARVVEYGVPLLDKYYKHERGHTHTIAAQPSVGKTALALTIVRGVLSKGGTVFMSVKESDAEEIMCKLICQEANVAYHIMRYDQSQLTKPQFDRIHRAIEYIYSMQDRIYLYGGKDWEHSTDSIEAQIEQIEQRGAQLDLIVTDYVQNLKVPLRIQSRPRHQQVEWLVEKMADIHKRFDAAGILLSQLNRNIEKEPHLHNLKEASKIEEESSMITFLHRDKAVQPVNSQLPTLIYSEKNRNGELWGMRDGWVMNIPSTHFSTKLHKYEQQYQPSIQV
jgi:replicative DNA helicase